MTSLLISIYNNILRNNRLLQIAITDMHVSGTACKTSNIIDTNMNLFVTLSSPKHWTNFKKKSYAKVSYYRDTITHDRPRGKKLVMELFDFIQSILVLRYYQIISFFIYHYQNIKHLFIITKTLAFLNLISQNASIY